MFGSQNPVSAMMVVQPALRGLSRSAHKFVYGIRRKSIASGGESSHQMLGFWAGLGL